MTATPSQLLVTSALGLATLAILIVALLLLAGGVLERRRARLHVDPDRTRVAALRRPARLMWLLVLPLLLLAWVFAGRYLVLMSRPSGDGPADVRQVTSRVQGASGADLAVETAGPAGAPLIVFTHGWGADAREWSRAKSLADRYQVLIWDLPGLGQSGAIPDGRYTLDNMAGDLKSVVDASGARSVILVGHSIGGMLNLEYARRFPEDLGRKVVGIVQLNTTYTNPLRTTKNAERQVTLQKPLYEPLLNSAVVASPVVRALGWLSYSSGLAHLRLASQSFTGTETREELDWAARYAYRSSPAVVASGALAMLNWDASDALQTVRVPTLVVAGAQDTTTLPEASDVMAERIPNARKVTIDPAAHLGPVEQHERYLEAVRAFAADVDNPRAGGGVASAPR
jgi:pimeloyl-ACP methyl ester carboxylesterase